ncbi:MAG TPA: NAD(P)H-quinone oxidoreductase [Candidatus Eremiobacteraceae bacterium]|nr:NAD(P)H-quinone oxidoreductase [Candidatus Eremiobacteraceae bacterium]
MRALVITRPGGPEVLSVFDRSKPEPRGDVILVRVSAAGVNRADLLQREGHYPAPADSPQDIPGLEYSGVIEAIGPDVKSRKVGQRVFGLVGGGAQAEYLMTREQLSMLVPDSVSDIEAGAIPEAYITAHDALYTQGGAANGERVLIHAVGSGVGIAVLQLAKARNCTVFGTSRTPAKLEKAKALGLDVGIDPKATPFDEIAHDVDVVIDFIGAPYLEQNLTALRTRGRLIVVSTLGGTNASLSLRTLMSKRLRINGTMLRARPYEEKIEATRAFERDVMPLLANGSIHVPIEKTFTLEQADQAHELIASNANFGKVVFTLHD